MPDREKVIDALKACSRADVTVECKQAGCPYWDEDNCTGKMARDALELLKWQEPVEPIRQWDDDETTWWYSCGSCVQAVDYKDKYCRHCGRGLRWDA